MTTPLKKNTLMLYTTTQLNGRFFKTKKKRPGYFTLASGWIEVYMNYIYKMKFIFTNSTT